MFEKSLRLELRKREEARKKVPGLPIYNYQRSFSPNWTLRIGATKLVIAPMPPVTPAWDGKLMLPSARADRQEAALGVQPAIRNVELRRVEEVKELSPELQFHTLRESEVLKHGEIHILEPGTFQDAIAGVSVMAEFRH